MGRRFPRSYDSRDVEFEESRGSRVGGELRLRGEEMGQSRHYPRPDYRHMNPAVFQTRRSRQTHPTPLIEEDVSRPPPSYTTRQEREREHSDPRPLSDSDYENYPASLQLDEATRETQELSTQDRGAQSEVSIRVSKRHRHPVRDGHGEGHEIRRESNSDLPREVNIGAGGRVGGRGENSAFEGDSGDENGFKGSGLVENRRLYRRIHVLKCHQCCSHNLIPVGCVNKRTDVWTGVESIYRDLALVYLRLPRKNLLSMIKRSLCRRVSRKWDMLYNGLSCELLTF